MKCFHWKITQWCLAGGLLLSAAVSPVAAQSGTGVARVAKPRTAPSKIQPAGFTDVSLNDVSLNDVITDTAETAEEMAEPFARVSTRNVSLSQQMCEPAAPAACPADCECQSKAKKCYCKECREQRRQERKCEKEAKRAMCRDKYHGHCPDDGCYGCHGYGCHPMLNYFHCKFGFLCPTGNGGAGSPHFGCYSRVYPENVYHSDSRDGQLYSAQGYGVPIAVPLAPTVGHAYNYGWGIPSSRLTPISHVAPR